MICIQGNYLKKKIAPPFERQTEKKRDTAFLSMIQYLIDKKMFLINPSKIHKCNKLNNHSDSTQQQPAKIAIQIGKRL